MKNILICLIVLFCFTIYAQSPNNDNVKKQLAQIYSDIYSENWQEVYEKSDSLEHQIKGNKEYELESQILNFIYVSSISVLLNKGHFTKEEALEKANHKLKDTLILPPVTFLINCESNCITKVEGMPNAFVSYLNNTEGTKTYSENYIHMKTPVTKGKNQLQGKKVSCRGQLQEIEVVGNDKPWLKFILNQGEFRLE